MIRAIRAIVELDDFSFDAYQMPDGEKRIGFLGASNVLGYADNWLGRLHKGDSRQLKAIQGMGYSGLQTEVEIIQRGREISAYGTRANTISLRDFIKLVTYEAIKKTNTRAITILASMAEFGFEQVIDMAFAGNPMDEILSKIVHFSLWTQEEWEQALADNREDLANLRLGMWR